MVKMILYNETASKAYTNAFNIIGQRWCDSNGNFSGDYCNLDDWAGDILFDFTIEFLKQIGVEYEE